MDLKLNGLSVLVSGGTAGIGEAVVKAMAQEGCNVAFCSRSQEKVEATIRALEGSPGQVIGRALDVTNTDDFSDWIRTLERIDVFIPNVSALSPNWEQSLAIDISSTVRCVDAVLPYVTKSRHAAITYIGSKASSFGTPGFESYGAAKAAMTHYMKSLSHKLTPSGVRVNVVSPGDTFVAGGFWDNIKNKHIGVYEAALKSNPMGRLCTPEEVARVVAFISSPAASFIAGANLLVDGGATEHVHG
jgi:NAD(P)-dependent dehydrogenase (short-subunit alcohol dehydrogenase family)